MEDFTPLLWLAFLFLLVGGLVLLFFLGKRTSTPDALPYIPTPLLTEAEKKFFTTKSGKPHWL